MESFSTTWTYNIPYTCTFYCLVASTSKYVTTADAHLDQLTQVAVPKRQISKRHVDKVQITAGVLIYWY